MKLYTDSVQDIAHVLINVYHKYISFLITIIVLEISLSATIPFSPLHN